MMSALTWKQRIAARSRNDVQKKEMSGEPDTIEHAAQPAY